MHRDSGLEGRDFCLVRLGKMWRKSKLMVASRTCQSIAHRSPTVVSTSRGGKLRPREILIECMSTIERTKVMTEALFTWSMISSSIEVMERALIFDDGHIPGVRHSKHHGDLVFMVSE